MRTAALLAVLSAAGAACAADSRAEERASDASISADSATLAPLRRGLAMFFRLDEARSQPRLDSLGRVALVPWRRTAPGQYSIDSRGTTAVDAAVGAGQHIQGSTGYHFATGSAEPMQHGGGSFTWSAWVSVDAAQGDEPYNDDQTLLAKWNAVPDTFAPNDHREYRIWHDEASSRWSFEVSADGLEGPGHSQRVVHPTLVERDRLYFVEASHDAERETIQLRVSTQSERGAAEEAPWSGGVFSGDADLDVGAQNTCTDDHLQGVVDALGYWTRALSDEESAAVWHGGAGLEF